MSKETHPHYYKDVSHLESVDVYRVAELFELTSAALFSALKKILCAGVRGAKNADQDVQEAIEALQRWQAMRAEDRRSAHALAVRCWCEKEDTPEACRGDECPVGPPF